MPQWIKTKKVLGLLLNSKEWKVQICVRMQGVKCCPKNKYSSQAQTPEESTEVQ